MALPLTKSEGSAFKTKQKWRDEDGLHLRGAHLEGHVPHYSCLERLRELPAHPPAPPLRSPTCSRSGSGGGKVSDMTSIEVSMSGTAGDWGGTDAEEGWAHAPRTPRFQL